VPERAPAPNGKVNGVHVDALVAPAPAAEVPAAPKAPARREDDASLEESLIPRRRGGVHPMAYAFVAAAAVFGGVAAWVLLRPQQPQIVVVQAPPPVSPNAPAAPNASPPPPPDVEGKGQPQVEVGEPSTAPNAVAHPGFGARPKASASAAPVAAAPIDTSSFVNNVPGPAATAAPQGNAGGNQLSSSEISAVVAQNQAIIKRKCWVPALEAKPPNAPSSAKVLGSLVIGSSGSVESANASGGDAFPGLASCIASRMKNWKFPPSSGSTPVNVPFVFAGQ
jgi:hypothetical protein